VILLVEDNADDEALMLRAFKQNNILNPVLVIHGGAEAPDFLFGTGIHQGRDMTVQPQGTAQYVLPPRQIAELLRGLV
jgi:hypothetical protein